MKLQPNQTQVGQVIITRQKDGTFRCVDMNGAGISTHSTYAEAVHSARNHNATRALVRIFGKDEAINLIRAGVLAK